MNWLDIVILVPLAFFAWQGFKNGFIMEIFTLAALILGIWASLEFSYIAEKFLVNQFNLKTDYLHIISFIVTFIIVVVAVNLLGKVVEKIFHAIAFGALDKVLGGVFGVVKGIVFLTILVYVFDSFNMKKGLIADDVKEESTLYPKLEDISTRMIDYVFNGEKPDIQKHRERIEEVVEETFNT